MTAIQFELACAQRTIAPEIALENKNICEALKERNDERVLWLLDNEF